MVVDFIAFVFVIFLSRMEEIVVAVMLLKRAALLRVFVFFFSSRRRHTISLCDWSSDVCSSDLVPVSALERTLYLEADRMGFLAGHISKEMLERERGVVQNEKRQGENAPYAKAFVTLDETI